MQPQTRKLGQGAGTVLAAASSARAFGTLPLHLSQKGCFRVQDVEALIITYTVLGVPYYNYYLYYFGSS